jgi:cytochrome c
MTIIANGVGDSRIVIVELPYHVSKGTNMTMKKLLIAATLSTVTTGSAFAQDLAAGETTFKKCAICHDIGETAKNKVGPELNGIDGRQSGSAPNYNYSDANKKSGITWNEATFMEYIKDPRAKIPGTKMIYPGIKNETEAKALWAYLKQFGPDGKKH